MTESKRKIFTQKDSEIIFYAFRYCLGRMSYAVSNFCDYARVYIYAIGRHELELMDKEITEAQEWDAAQEKKEFHGRLGMDCDRRDWLKLRDAIRDELKRRDEKGAGK